MTKGAAVLYVNHQKALKGDQKAMHNIYMLAEVGQLLQDPAEAKPIGGKILVPEPFDSDEEWAAHAAKVALERRKKQGP